MAGCRTTAARVVAPLADLCLLSRFDLSATLAAELREERAACDRAMAEVIRRAQVDEPYLSSSVFSDPTECERRLLRTEAAFLQLPDPRRPRGITERVIADVYRLLVAELHVAERLREARLPVSHADRPGYWPRLGRAWANGRGFQPMEAAHG